MAKLGDHALVLGGSIAGLLAARVLADFYDRVTVVERDELPCDPANRRGVPQGRHPHALLAGGARTVGALFPGILEELVADGAPMGDDGDLSRLYLCYTGHVMPHTGTVTGDPKELALFQPSRALLECHIRRRLRALRNVTVVDGYDVTDLTATADRSRITGAHVVARGTGAEQALTADLVVDAMGRAAHTPATLESLGYGRPVEERIVMHTTYVSQALRVPPDTIKETLTVVSPVPGRPTGLFLAGYENDVWIFTAFGMTGNEAPHDLPGMLDFVAGFAPPHVRAAARAGEPIAPVVQHKMPCSQWRRYDKMRRFPAGLLVCGDAMCSFNPIYGQGMSVASMDALALQQALRGGTANLSCRYFRAAGKATGLAWALGAGSDLAFPEVEGKRTPSMRFTAKYVDWVLTAAETDHEVFTKFSRVTGLVDPPARLFHPALAYRVARVNHRRRHQVSLTEQSDLVMTDQLP